MPPLVQPGNPCRFLQNHPPRLGLGIDQFGDLALAHQGRRMRPGRGIGEQHLHIAGAHVPGVGLVGRAGVAGDPPRDLDLVGIVEPGRGQPVGVVDHDGDFGEMPGRAAGRAVEDHILHPAAAHRRGPVFAHHPAQRLQQVGLAAAIGADHAGQPRVDHHIHRVDKAFETVQAQPDQAQRGFPVIPSNLYLWGGRLPSQSIHLSLSRQWRSCPHDVVA